MCLHLGGLNALKKKKAKQNTRESKNEAVLRVSLFWLIYNIDQYMAQKVKNMCTKHNMVNK